MDHDPALRRPIASRGSGWARALAGFLVARRVAPNAISVASVVFALGTGTAFVLAGLSAGGGRIAWLVAGALLVPARLVANLLDGLVAVEGGLGGKSGEIYNELPDRLSDSFALLGAGYGAALVGPAWAADAGWAAALAAVLTAYVRTLGVAAGAPADFLGPMAKQQRMVTLAVAALAAAVETALALPPRILPAALVGIAALALLTAARRALATVRFLERR